MDYNRLGHSGLRVPALSFGTGTFGGGNDFFKAWGSTDAAGASRLIDVCLDHGVSLFDTADVYSAGLAEQILGEAIKGKRNRLLISTKATFPTGDGPNDYGSSRQHLLAAVEGSLKRLGVETIDLFQLHGQDYNTPVEETLSTLDQLVRAGKVRYIGHSNFAAWQAVDAHWISRNRGLASYVSAQNQYNLLDRRIERELVPACREFGVGILPYFPLASGFLTGKYKRGAEPPKGTRLAMMQRMAKQALTDENFATLEALEKFSSSREHTILELAVGWLASQLQVSSVISGATSPEQVTQNVKAGNWKLSAEELAEVDKLTRR